MAGPSEGSPRRKGSCPMFPKLGSPWRGLPHRGQRPRQSTLTGCPLPNNHGQPGFLFVATESGLTARWTDWPLNRLYRVPSGLKGYVSLRRRFHRSTNFLRHHRRRYSTTLLCPRSATRNWYQHAQTAFDKLWLDSNSLGEDIRISANGNPAI